MFLYLHLLFLQYIELKSLFRTEATDTKQLYLRTDKTLGLCHVCLPPCSMMHDVCVAVGLHDMHEKMRSSNGRKRL